LTRTPKCADNMLASSTSKLARSDYAINVGTRLSVSTPCGAYMGVGIGPAVSSAYNQWVKTCVVPARDYDGVNVPGSGVRMASITDGASNTYLVGEKYLSPTRYFDGSDVCDNESMYMGDNGDIGRWGGPTFQPYQDCPGYDVPASFGSAHSNSFQMAFCDGSVHQISYAIDLETHRRLSNRKDGLTIDAKKL
jgi:prepilin-type processing-associated H-X9-DG protein